MRSTNHHRLYCTCAALVAGLMFGCHSELAPNLYPHDLGEDIDPAFFVIPETSGPVFANPSTFAATNPELFWDTLADIVGDYFRIKVEQPVHLVGNTLMEGRVETYPRHGATYLEPWRRDSVGSYERTHATLQSIRRWAHIRIIPTPQGLAVDVRVFKELEDLQRPEHALASVASFQFRQDVGDDATVLADVEPSKGWIPLGRDAALEQRIIARLHQRLNPTAF